MEATKAVGYRLPVDLLEVIESHAQASGKDKTSVVVAALRRGLELESELLDDALDSSSNEERIDEDRIKRLIEERVDHAINTFTSFVGSFTEGVLDRLARIEERVLESDGEAPMTVSDLLYTASNTSNAQFKRRVTGSELARRFGCNPSSVSRAHRRTDFAQWSRSKDPDGLAWEFRSETQLFEIID